MKTQNPLVNKDTLRVLKKSLSEKLKITNPMALPRVEKVVVFSGVGKAKVEKELFEQVKGDLAKITGQRPVASRAKKSIAAFKVREGDVIGLKVTLRGKRRDDFLEKLAKIVLPTQRDFKGISEKNLDKDNNLNLGFREDIVFPEVRHEHTAKVFGLQVSVRIKAKDKEQAKALLEALGFPFKKGE